MSRNLGDFELPEPQNGTPESGRHKPGQTPVASFGSRHGFGKVIVAIATMATIIGGVAAAVQLWAYWNPPKVAPRRLDKESSSEWTEIRPGFKARLGPGWEILDRSAYEAAARIQFGNLPVEDMLGEKHYIVRRGDASRTAGFAMLAISNVSPDRTVDGLVQEGRDVASRNGGMIAQGVSLESAEVVSTDGGDCARFITGVYDTQGAPMIVMSYFVWYRDGQSYALYFYSLPNEAPVDSPEFLSIAKSVRFQ